MSNGRVINSHNRDRYNIKKYEFRSTDDLSTDHLADDGSDQFVPLSSTLGSDINHPVQKQHHFDESETHHETHQHMPLPYDAPTEVTASQAEITDMLYKKIEEFSDKVVKLEMALEAKHEELESLVATARQEAYDGGYKACSDEIGANYEKELADKDRMISASVQKLDSSARNFEQKLEEIQKDLVTTALAISSEVIKIEVSQKGSQIAMILAKEMLSKLQGASDVVVKVNSEDFDLLNGELGENAKVTLEADDAIARGGVIVMSSMGNLDGTISSRLEKIIKEATEK